MKTRFIPTILTLFMCASAVSCGVTEKESVIVNETITELVTTIGAQTEPVSTAAFTTTVTETTSAVTEDENIRTIVEEVCIRYYDSPGYTEERAAEDAEYMIGRAKEFTEHDPVEVTSEDAAESRAKTVFIEYMGQDFIDTLESDFVEMNGETLRLERKYPPYKCVYYDAYDVWAVTAVLRSGKLENGGSLEHTGESPYVFIRGKDGALLAAYC